jgi:hypothetical protein
VATAIFAAVLGLLIAAACLGIPQLIRIRHQQPNDDDTRAYLRETGRSSRDIAQGNAEVRAQQEKDARSEPTGAQEPVRGQGQGQGA